jgi:hypothetical protein
LFSSIDVGMYWSITYALCDLVVGFVNYEEGMETLLLLSEIFVKKIASIACAFYIPICYLSLCHLYSK